MQKITMMETETTLMDSVWVSNYTELCNLVQKETNFIITFRYSFTGAA